MKKDTKPKQVQESLADLMTEEVTSDTIDTSDSVATVASEPKREPYNHEVIGVYADQQIPAPAAEANSVEPIIADMVSEYPKQVATIDAGGIYLGMSTINTLEEVTEYHLTDINECDLPAGQYRWDKENKRFEVVPTVAMARKVSEHHTLYAIAQGFLSLQEAGHEFPLVTKNWLTWYQEAVQGKFGPVKPIIPDNSPVPTPRTTVTKIQK